MRSELVFDTMAYVSDRFLLTMLVSKATRRFHKSNTRIQDTTNNVFVRLSRANAIGGCGISRDSQPFRCAAS
jgi:hypothetical protein